MCIHLVNYKPLPINNRSETVHRIAQNKITSSSSYFQMGKIFSYKSLRFLHIKPFHISCIPSSSRRKNFCSIRRVLFYDSSHDRPRWRDNLATNKRMMSLWFSVEISCPKQSAFIDLRILCINAQRKSFFFRVYALSSIFINWVQRTSQNLRATCHIFLGLEDWARTIFVQSTNQYTIIFSLFFDSSFMQIS